MVVFPPAKINLGLDILSRRPDGYHNLESCFLPIPWHDVLEVIPSARLEFTSSGLDIPGGSHSNLCLRAYHILAENHSLPPVHIHLHKAIPMGAGLGGGSADGAYTLKVLNEIFKLRLKREELIGYASRLGSDCPFFLFDSPMYATGTGTTLETLSLSLAGWHLVVVKPPIHVSTAEAYAGIRPEHPSKHVREILTQLPMEEWRQHLKNDFEISVFQKFPEIKKIKDWMYTHGATYASMSGSGSAVYGLFRSAPSLAGIAPEVQIKAIALR
jgi:4-diphosphocytidyl-2-C-methyl-D-erythritol kinase